MSLPPGAGALPATAASLRGHHQLQRRSVETVVAARHRAAQGCAQRSVDHDRRRGLRRAEHLRWHHPYAQFGSHRQHGLRYTNFNSTALCSPTRAALITGRNHHSADTGVVVEQVTGFPGYNSMIGKDTATIGEILKQNGYATSGSERSTTRPFGNRADRSLRPLARRLGISVLLRIRRW